MDINKIRALAELFDKYSLTEISFTEADSEITLKRQQTAIPIQKQQLPETIPMNDINEPSPIVNESIFSFGDVIEIKAPLVGVFYAAVSPDSEPYVKIGSKVKKGDILCIVEAMKLMNEITAEFDGEIVDICVENGQIVEYGQILFKII